MSKTVTVTEKFDDQGNLIERVTETSEYPDGSVVYDPGQGNWDFFSLKLDNPPCKGRYEVIC